MVIGSVAGKFIFITKPFFDGVQSPLLWLTAYLTLSELIAIRKAVSKVIEDKNNGTVFVPLTKHIIEKFTEGKKLYIYLGKDSTQVLSEINKVPALLKSNVDIYLPVGAHLPDRTLLANLKNAVYKVTHITCSSSFAIVQHPHNQRSVFLLGICGENGTVFAELDGSEKYAEQLTSVGSDIEKNSVLVSLAQCATKE